MPKIMRSGFRKIKLGMIFFLLFIVMFENIYAQSSTHNEFIPYRKGNKWGFCDYKKNVLTSIVFDSADILEKNLGVISLNGKYGVIDNNNKTVVPLMYDKITLLNNLIITYSGAKCGFYSPNGTEIVSTMYDEITKTCCATILKVCNNNKFGLISTNGNEIIPIKYNSIRLVDESCAIVVEEKKDILINITNNQSICSCSFDYFDNFCNDLAIVKLNNEYGIIDKDCNIRVPIMYNRIYQFKNGLSRVVINGKMGFVNKEGKLVIPLNYQDYDSLFFDIDCGCEPSIKKNTLVKAKRNNKYGFIDKFGNDIIPFFYDNADDNYGFEDLYIIKLKTKWGCMDGLGKLVIPIIYDDIGFQGIHEVPASLIPVILNNKWGCLDKLGKVVIPLDYNHITSFGDNYYVEKNKKWGVFNNKGNLIIPIDYDKIGDMNENMFEIESNSKHGFINKYGTLIIKLKYDYAGGFINGISKVLLNGKYGFINAEGKEYWDDM